MFMKDDFHQRPRAEQATDADAPDSPGKRTRTDRVGASVQRSDAPAGSQQDRPPRSVTELVPVSSDVSFVDSILSDPAPVQRRARESAAGDDVHALAAEGTSGSPGSLPFMDQIQRSFGGHDVSGIKAHVGGPAADAARGMGATAFATGDHVAFASSPDLHTAAHEAAHVVQQRGGVQLKGGVGESGDTHEQHADAVADAVVHGRSAEALLGHYDAPSPAASVQRQAVQFFDGDEHKKLGDDATGGERLKEFGDLNMSFGDMVMIAGDLFGDVETVRDLARTPEGRAEIKYAIWHAKEPRSRGKEPKVSPDIKNRVEQRYYGLAADNIPHFSEGGTAKETYLSYHNKAMSDAYLSVVFGKPEMFDQALTNEAFGQHFLSDTFSAGHVRTPRAAWEKAEERQEVPSNARIIQFLASRIYHHLYMLGDFSRLEDKLAYEYIIVEKIEPKIRDTAGASIDAVTSSDLLAKVQHDLDGKGLDVVSYRDAKGKPQPEGHHWHAVGDGKVIRDGKVLKGGADTYAMAQAAMKRSRLEIDLAVAQAKKHGGTPRFDPKEFGAGQALDYVPKADSTNPGIADEDGTPESKERWNRAIDEVFRASVVPTVRTIYKPDDEITEAGRTLHVGKAVARLAKEMELSPHTWLKFALEWQYSAPSRPPDIAGVPMPAPPPTDAGVGQ